MRFLWGLIVGMIIGGGGVFLGLERPWAGEHSAEQADAATDVVPGSTAAAAGPRPKGKRGKRGKRPRASAGAGEPVLGAADRKLVWRGDEVKLPPRTLDLADDSEARSLSAAEINQVLKGQSGAMIACIEEARGSAPLEARIVLKLLVDGGGQVTRMRVRAPAYLFAHGFHACARKAARGMRFPATGAATIVEAPYDLASSAP